MTSQINPNNIDGNYPIAGVSNNTQGMRDNFTNIKTNFQYAEDELNDLQSKAVLKAALTGTTLDNNMNDNLIYAAKLQDLSWTYVQNTATAGSITLDYSAGQYQQINPSGPVSLAFTNWPASGSAGQLFFVFNVTNVSQTLTLPATVNRGIATIAGSNPGTAGVTNTITFDVTGYYVFQFVSTDGGSNIYIFDDVRPPDVITSNLTIANSSVSTSTTTGALVVQGGTGIQGNLNIGGNVIATGNILLNAGGTMGYTTGAGGTVAQTGNKSGNVTLNKPSGEITMQNTNLAAATTVDFYLTNNTITATDLLIINQTSTANAGGYVFNAKCNAGNAQIFVRNVMAATAGDAVVLRYAVVKGATT